MQIRFHLDESVDHAVARGLRRRDIDTSTATDAELIGAPDEEHVAFALSENRVLFTHDADFLRLARVGIRHAGIVYVHPRRMSLGDMILRLVALWRRLDAEDMPNRVVFL